MSPQSMLPSLTEILAVVPEIALALLILAVLTYDRLLKPAERRRVGLLTAWGGVVVLLLTVGIWVFFGVPDASQNLSESLL